MEPIELGDHGFERMKADAVRPISVAMSRTHVTAGSGSNLCLNAGPLSRLGALCVPASFATSSSAATAQFDENIGWVGGDCIVNDYAYLNNPYLMFKRGSSKKMS